MSNGRPWPVRCPAAFSRVTSSSLLVVGPSRVTSSMAAAGVRLAVPGWTGLSAVSSSVAPVCQRIPIRALLVGLGQHGDVGDQGAQQPFAVPGAGGRRVPQGGQVSGEFLQVVPAGQRRQRVLGGLQRLLGFSEGGEPGLPSGLQGAGDQPVLRLDLAERPLGAVGLVAGTLHGELGRPADPLVLAGHLIGGDSASATCPGVSASSSAPATASSTQAATTVRQDGVVRRSRRELHS